MKLKITVLLLLCYQVVFGQINPAKIDSLIFTQFKKSDGPGAVFMVAKDGKAIYSKAFGKANLELSVDMSTENVFQLGSMTKQFTAIAILMLEEQGKLHVSDLISKTIPNFPNGNKITIHQLLTHTSGIKDFTKMKALSSIAQKEMTPKMMVDFFKNEPTDFPPGDKFDYNNSGYVVLGYLIELISGETYEDFVKNHIFKKAGMLHSYYASDKQLIINRASGYQKKDQNYVNKTVINFSVPFSSGALMSTVGDLLKWQNALDRYALVNAGSLKKAYSSYKLNNGESFNYGYGWHISQIKGLAARKHGGSIFGFKTMAFYIPDLDLYVVGLSNCECNSPTRLTEDITTLLVDFYKT